jgi:hypothetical protein
MNHGTRMPDVNIGVFSRDGNFYWNGAQWKAAVSPDGCWRWNGTAWVATLQSFAVAGALGLACTLILRDPPLRSAAELQSGAATSGGDGRGAVIGASVSESAS